MDEHDAERFQLLLYTSNSDTPIHISNLHSPLRQGKALPRMIERSRGNELVHIAAYALMPNHFHLLLQEVDYGGISAFMQKLGTGYTMFFNKKYNRTGALFSGKFKAVHIGADRHARRIINYIHANPAELYEAQWKEGKIKNSSLLKKRLLAYPYSSLPDYEGVQRVEKAIVDLKNGQDVLGTKPSLESMLRDARELQGVEL